LSAKYYFQQNHKHAISTGCYMLDVRRHKRSTIPWNYKKDIFPWKKFMENSIPLSPQKISNSIFFLRKKRVKITITEVIIKLLQVPWKISVIPWFSEEKKRRSVVLPEPQNWVAGESWGSSMNTYLPTDFKKGYLSSLTNSEIE